MPEYRPSLHGRTWRRLRFSTLNHVQPQNPAYVIGDPRAHGFRMLPLMTRVIRIRLRNMLWLPRCQWIRFAAPPLEIVLSGVTKFNYL